MAGILNTERSSQAIVSRSPPPKGRPLTPGKLLLGLMAMAALLLLILPLAVLVVRGVGTEGWQGLPDSGVPQAIRLSLLTSLVSAIFTLLLGTPLAYILARWHFPFRNLLNVFVQLPIVLPPAVAGLGLLLTFGRQGLLGPVLATLGVRISFSITAVIIAQFFVAAPFFIRSAQVGFQNIPVEVEDAARVDGAAGLMLFWYITLPLASRAMAAGLLLSWARALGEFGATILFAGSLPGRTQTMSLLVYNVLERDIDAAIWTGLLLVGIALLAMLLAQWLLSRDTD